MKKGETYKIFEDPITREKLEGFATIIEFAAVEDVRDTLHFCAVRFEGESQTYQRKVDERDLIK